MIRLHILTPGFISPNSRAFLFPLIVWRRHLARRGIDVRLVQSVEACTGCDVVVVDSKYHRDLWQSDQERILADFAALRKSVDTVVYCDTTDSTSWIQVELLPVVDRYWKLQLLRDRSQYLRPMYGYRIYADYYHRTQGVEDTVPEWSSAITDLRHLDKLGVAWNSALADYSLLGRGRMAAYRHVPVTGLLRFPRRQADPAAERPLDVSCRFGVHYSRQSVAWQRQEVRRLMADRVPTDRLSHRRYMAEMAASKVVLSPFGWGEINYRDYEAFLTGGALFKPDMSHMETWPDLFRPDESIFAHSWDLSDFAERLEAVLADDAHRIEVARCGQDLYRRHTVDRDAAELFVHRLKTILEIGG